MDKQNPLQDHQARIHHLGLIVLGAHIPLLLVMARFFDTTDVLATALPAAIIAVQFLVARFGGLGFAVPLMGFSVMAFSGIMIHLGKGMIEWHFHIFVMIGLLTLLADVRALLVAALTAAVHHLTFYFYLPASIFNYQASFGIVAIHSAFVVVQTIACVYVATVFRRAFVVQGKLTDEFGPLLSFLQQVSRGNNDSAHLITAVSTENAAALEQLSDNSEEISVQVSTTTDNCQRAQNLSRQSYSEIQGSEETLNKLNQAGEQMEALRVTLAELQADTHAELQAVMEAVNQVTAKTAVVGDFATRTKLLSLNASIEAARVGSQSAGFAVIAQEIGQLASNSGGASREIAELAERSNGVLNSAVGKINSEFTAANEVFEAAATLFLHSRESLNEAVQRIGLNSRDLNGLLTEISSAAGEQSQGVDSLRLAISNVAAGSNELDGAAQNILKSSSQVSQEFHRFRSLYNEVTGIMASGKGKAARGSVTSHSGAIEETALGGSA
ncbi:methyl-accepting chemotaxis protein [Microbulbifer aggregans]|uniref:methyl-accepting chemotaxis protein n=1 Tax=Microbulbifer aggregans TaxID=1769779 RepID=UPI001CFCD42E|nr:methyl-accepting chemotaxis protein [Microbulbifer aggregans]